MKPAQQLMHENDVVIHFGTREEAHGAAMRAYYEDTHQLTEGAGAAALAALLQERDRFTDRKVGLILSGGNIDRPVYLRTLAGD